MSPLTITVFGSSQPRPGSVAYEQARRLGRLLGEAGFDVVNGGYSGTMEAVSRGVAEAGGQATGITCAAFDSRRAGGNAYLSQVVHAPTLIARLEHLVERGDAFVVLAGGIGTLLELFLVWNLTAIGVLPKPCLLIGAHWRQVLAGLECHTEVRLEHIAMLHVVDTPEEAVKLLQGLPSHR